MMDQDQLTDQDDIRQLSKALLSAAADAIKVIEELAQEAKWNGDEQSVQWALPRADALRSALLDFTGGIMPEGTIRESLVAVSDAKPSNRSPIGMIIERAGSIGMQAITAASGVSEIEVRSAVAIADWNAANVSTAEHEIDRLGQWVDEHVLSRSDWPTEMTSVDVAIQEVMNLREERDSRAVEAQARLALRDRMLISAGFDHESVVTDEALVKRVKQLSDDRVKLGKELIRIGEKWLPSESPVDVAVRELARRVDMDRVLVDERDRLGIMINNIIESVGGSDDDELPADDLVSDVMEQFRAAREKLAEQADIMAVAREREQLREELNQCKLDLADAVDQAQILLSYVPAEYQSPHVKDAIVDSRGMTPEGRRYVLSAVQSAISWIKTLDLALGQIRSLASTGELGNEPLTVQDSRSMVAGELSVGSLGHATVDDALLEVSVELARLARGLPRGDS